MENNQYDQIRLLAKKISQAEREDISAMHAMARELYEKLTVLLFLEENTQVDEKTIISPEDISMVENEWQHLENEAILDGKRDVEEIEIELEDDIRDNENAEEIVKIVSESLKIEGELNVSDELEIVKKEQLQEEIEEKERPKRQKQQSKTDDTLQKSLFDQDLFSSEIIGFDPDEDIFIEASAVKKEQLQEKIEADKADDNAVQNIEIEEQTEEILSEEKDDETKIEKKEKSSFFSFKILDDVTHSVENEEEIKQIYEDLQDKASEKSFEQIKYEEEQPLKEKDEQVVENVGYTVNDVIGNSEEKQQISLNDVLSSKNINISLNDRLAFINNLFDGEVDDFENTVRYIFSQNDVDVVVEYISEIVKPYYNNWIDKEQYEKRFMNIVIKYFAGK